MGPIHLETQTKPVNRMPIASRNVARGCTHTVVERLDPDIGVSAYTGWPERSRTALSIGSRAVPQFIDCRRAVHQSTLPARRVYASRLFETSRSALIAYTIDTPSLPRVSVSD